MGVDWKNWIVIIIGLIIVLIVSNFQQKGMVRQMIASKNIAIRWVLYLALFFAVIIFGSYGMGYDASSFIYGAF